MMRTLRRKRVGLFGWNEDSIDTDEYLPSETVREQRMKYHMKRKGTRHG